MRLLSYIGQRSSKNALSADKILTSQLQRTMLMQIEEISEKSILMLFSFYVLRLGKRDPHWTGSI